MTEYEARKKICDIIDSWIGLTNNGKCPKIIADTYNDFIARNNEKWKSLPRSTKMSIDYAWCACTVSSAAILAGYAMTIIPVEISCNNLITMATEKGIWFEDESRIESYQIGNIVLYDWDDSGTGDNVGSADHVGLITKVDGDYITVTEGNYSKTVKQRKIKRNAKYIRGIICPHYKQVSEPEAKPEIVVLNLAYGAKGEAVKALQILLNGRNNARLTVDGGFGKNTEKAVKQAQNKYNMVENGVCNVALWNHLING